MSRILFVDDDLGTLQLIELVLGQQGHQVLTASSGAGALRAMQDDLPDLILLDLMMPVMDGYEVCRQVRANPRTAHIPIVVLSAKAQIESQVEAFRCGVDGYLVKPVHLSELITRIEAVLERAAVPPPAAPGTAIGILGSRGGVGTTMVDARLPDGSRVNVIISPCALDGSVITIRKFPSKRLTIEDLIRLGTLSEQVAEFIRACVLARLNIVVSGGTGSGKTTLLNVLSSFIPSDERIVTIEDSAELQLHQRHVVRLETAPVEPDGTGQVTIHDLVINALRMRPDRIVVGEVRGGEALDMLQAMNTGHDGSLTTVHANTPRDAISRLETLVLMSGFDLPLKVARAQIASAVDLIIQQERMRDGSRKITRVTEVQGMEGDIVVLQDVFIFQAKALSEEGDRVEGEIKPTGIRPNFVPRLEAAGVELPPATFVDPSGVAGRLMRESDNLRSHRRSRR
ncbi:MAG: Flp pilus assembly complex ATPase component TadA [Chloroflexi bacterium]|nr:Flp pilus assembly complex ATPase component TadA [Chloroflexota bacterium]